MTSFEDALIRAFGERMKTDDALCRSIWSAMANVRWYHPEDNLKFSVSFRSAGDVIAEIRGEGDYLDWYCCGPSGVVGDEIWRSMKKEGWIADNHPDICDEPGCLKNASVGSPTESAYRMTCHEHSPNHVFRKLSCTT